MPAGRQQSFAHDADRGDELVRGVHIDLVFARDEEVLKPRGGLAVFCLEDVPAVIGADPKIRGGIQRRTRLRYGFPLRILITRALSATRQTTSCGAGSCSGRAGSNRLP